MKSVIVQHENVRPHSARLTLQTIQKIGRELLSHPSYSPNLALSEYDLLGSLKDHLRGYHHDTDEAVRSWLRGAGTDFYYRSIRKTLKRWKKCTDRDGYFVGK
jgi:histone-lysine N-methyltransferase SETMAR